MKPAIDAAYRWGVLSRFVAAAAGGYAVVSLTQMALMVVLPVADYKALLFSMQTSYLYYTGVVIWCFAARTARRAWLGLAIVALPLALIDAGYWVHRSLS